MKLTQFVFTTLSLISLAAGQQFSCPTHSAGCDSYEELLKAKDQTVASSEVRYACFRDSSDEFFIIKAFDPLLLPSQWWKWNTALAVYELAPNESPEAILIVATFNKGVEDDARMPGLYARGRWVLMFNSLDYFGAASRFDSKTGKQVPNPDTSVTVDDTQVSLVNRYDAQSGKKVEYTLTIQRSTKRFSEGFNVLGDPKAGFENSGRCVEVNPMPKLPDHPALTGEQWDELKKNEFCSDYSTLSESEIGYCHSSFTYIEDYDADQQKKAKTKAKQ